MASLPVQALMMECPTFPARVLKVGQDLLPTGPCPCMPMHRKMYAYGVATGGIMARETVLKRTSLFVDVKTLKRARKALGVATDAEAVRVSVEHIVEMERFWRFMTKSRGTLKPGSIETP